jgi:hypothetical protein
MRGSVCACVQTAGGLSAAVAAACADDLAEDCSLVAAAPDSSASSNRFPAAQLAVGREVRMLRIRGILSVGLCQSVLWLTKRARVRVL